ncbi:MAG: DUF1361 domain-containing protein [Gaiellaceae bacterium]
MPRSHGSSSHRRVLALGLLAAASAFAAGLVTLRFSLSGSWHYRNLLWNLALAWVPLGLALLAYDRARRGASVLGLALPLGAWLLFLPNAPYLLTEFKMLREVDGMPLWYDVTMLIAFAWTGLLLGFVSVFLVQSIARRAAGSRAGWACALGSLTASGLGIYLGRSLHWNSWDLLLQPAGVLGDIARDLDSPRLLGMSLAIGTFLTLAYLMLYTMLEAAVEERAE